MDNDSRSCPTSMDAPLPTLPHAAFINLTHPNTPRNEIFALDEPSSALASRIMRAQDNPSPPPVSPSSRMTFTNDARLVDVSEPTTPCYLNPQLPGHAVPLLTTPPSSSFLCSLPSHQSPAQPLGDLITFDVDDELVGTSKPSSSLPRSPDPINTSSPSEAVKESTCEEEKSSSIFHSNTEEVEIPHSGDSLALDWRGGRTRRSTTSHRTSPSIASEDGHVQIGSPIETAPQVNNAWMRVRRKNAKTADVVEPQEGQTADCLDKQRSIIPEPENQNKDASDAGHQTHHRLSSLSPTSSHLLSQLVTTSRDETPHYSKPSISTEYTMNAAIRPAESQKTPSKDPIHTRSPQRLQLHQSPSKTAEARTPARRILVGEMMPSRSKPFNTLPSTPSSSHALNSYPPRTPISCISSSDSPARRMTDGANNSEDMIHDKTSSAEFRIGSPRRQLLDQSPSKTLPSAQFRTPARRIMIQNAAASSSKSSNIFPRIAASNNILNFDVARNSMFRIHSNDSPTRRVIPNDTITDGSEHTKHDNPRLHSPIRRTTVCSYTEEPPTIKATIKSRSNSVEPRSQPEKPTFSKSVDLRVPRPKPRKLPFPLIPEVIPEEPVNKKRPGAPSVHASALKQRTSKIPRIGIKPYARPTTTTRVSTNKLPDSVRHVEPPKQTPSLLSSQSARSNNTPDERSALDTISATPTANSSSTGLKRKRTSDDTTVPTEAPPTLRSVILDSVAQQATRTIETIKNVTLEPSNTPIVDNSHDTIQLPVVVVSETPEQPSLNVLTEEKCYLPSDNLAPVSGSSKTSALNSQPVETVDFNSTKARRTRSRTRTTTTNAITASRPTQSRKRVNNSTALDTDVFNSMSAVALKALTNSNTTRNQQYIAAKIETEVIRKLGARPTSPIIKTKTALQRMQDEKSRERRERAQRRAQRNGEALENGCVDTQQQPESPTPIALHLDIDNDDRDSERCDGHRKGAGDDEDYQPPDPQSRKRKMMNGFEHSEVRDGRRVKWDKGLYTEVRLDEIQLGARLLHKHSAILKGCLTSKSKAVQLDTMGNLPTASLPVEDLTEECVVVKKFVYDDDEEPPPPIALGTRSKVKKNKP